MKFNQSFKKPIGLLFALLPLAAIAPLCCHAHEQSVHMAITDAAARSSDELTVFLRNELGLDNAPFDVVPKLVAHPPPSENFSDAGYAPVSWLAFGSHHEDASVARSCDHFYKVLSSPVLGLTDKDEPFDLLYAFQLPSPIYDSFTWASRGNLREPRFASLQGDINTENWPSARSYQYAGLTSPNKPTRDENLAHMLYALGHVIHLNQDLAQPDHTRNDNHAQRHWIEKYGQDTYLKCTPEELKIRFPLRGHGRYPWRQAAFQKLEDFWDRHTYNGSAKALNDDAPSLAYLPDEVPQNQLGLAEFSNGNFLGEDSLYKEYFAYTDQHYFPLPSLQSSTDLRATVHAAGGTKLRGRYVKVEYLKNGVAGNRVFSRKIADGIPVVHHSVLTYTGVRIPISLSSLVVQLSSTIRSPNVLGDFHSILIPKAIEYSSGILDYFFRGFIVLDATISNTGRCTITVWNNSYQDLTGGQFSLYYDESNGNRNPVPGFACDYPGRLNDSFSPNDPHSFTCSFNPPSGDVARYTLVYSGGTIGVGGDGKALDPVDASIANAVCSFVLIWYQVSANDPGAAIYISQLHVDPWGYGDNNGPPDPGLRSGEYWGSVSTDTTDTRGEYDVKLASDRNVTCTLKRFFNTPSAPVSTESINIAPGSWYSTSHRVTVDGEYNLKTY